MVERQITLDYWLSPTKMLMFMEQYTDFYKVFFLGEEIPQNVYMKYGSLFHQLLEDYFKGTPEKDESLREYTNRVIQEKWKEYVENDSQFIELSTEERNIQTLKEDIQLYLRKFLSDANQLEKKYGSKSAFNMLKPQNVELELYDDDLKLKGIIDTVFLTSDRFNPASDTLVQVIGDYKTSKTGMKTIHTKYFFQLLVYALLMKLQTKINVDYVMLDFVRLNEKHFLLFEKNVVYELITFISELRAEINLLINKFNRGEDISSYKPRNRLKIFFDRLK